MFIATATRTTAGAARIAAQRVEALPQQESAPQPAPEPSNVVRMVIPRSPAQQVIHEIAEKHGLTVADIIGKSRARHIIPVRDEAIAAVKNLKVGDDKWSYSTPVIGRIFGNRDHTTILASLRRSALRGNA